MEVGDDSSHCSHRLTSEGLSDLTPPMIKLAKVFEGWEECMNVSFLDSLALFLGSLLYLFLCVVIHNCFNDP